MIEPEVQPARYGIAGKHPTKVLHPGDEQEVAHMLLAAQEVGETVVPIGGGTMLDVGNPPSRYSSALLTDRLTGIVEYNPGDLTVVVRAGTSLVEVDRTLQSHGQFLSLQAPFPERATIGGALAANSSGPLRVAYGSARDAVIGTRVALPNGQIARSGGRVVKNVAGYDLSKLFIGSFGTLGVIVEAAFRVYPRHESTCVAVIQAPDLETARAVSLSVIGLGNGVLSVAVINHQLARSMDVNGPCALVLLGGTKRGAAELRNSVLALAGGMTADVRQDAAAARVTNYIRDFPGRATFRLSSRQPAPHISVARLERVESLWYPTIGTSYLCAPTWTPDRVVEMRRELPSAGQLIRWHASPSTDGVSAWGDMGLEIRLMRAVKSVFDPHEVMSPGRFVGDI